MKHLLRKIITSAFSLYLTSLLIPQFSLPNAPREFVLLAIVFMFAQLIIKPIVKMLLLPLTVLTFGLIGAFADVIVLYLVDFALPKMSVGTVALNLWGTQITFKGVLAYITIALVLQITHTLIKWVVKD
jgi:putative membrane protein